MRVIDCDCGRTLQAANDDDLAKQVREHFDEEHEDARMTEDQARDYVAKRAYEATDS